MAKCGRLAHRVSKKDRRYVINMAGYGITQEEIADIIGISIPTLKKYFSNELKIAKAKKTYRVAAALFRNCTAEMNVTAQIFWLKCQARWKPEVDEAEQEKNASEKAKAIREALSQIALLENTEI